MPKMHFRPPRESISGDPIRSRCEARHVCSLFPESVVINGQEPLVDSPGLALFESAAKGGNFNQI